MFLLNNTQEPLSSSHSQVLQFFSLLWWSFSFIFSFSKKQRKNETFWQKIATLQLSKHNSSGPGRPPATLTQRLFECDGMRCAGLAYSGSTNMPQHSSMKIGDEVLQISIQILYLFVCLYHSFLLFAIFCLVCTAIAKNYSFSIYQPLQQHLQLHLLNCILDRPIKSFAQNRKQIICHSVNSQKKEEKMKR